MKKIMIMIMILCLIACSNMHKEDKYLETSAPIICLSANNEYLYYITTNADNDHFVLHQYVLNTQEINSIALDLEILEYVWDIKASDDGCIVYDSSINKQFIFDKQLNLIETKEIEEQQVIKHDFVDELYWYNDFYTTSIYTDFNKEQEIFTNQKDVAYLVNEDIFGCQYVYDDYVLCDQYSEEGVYLNIYDYKQSILVNQFHIETSMDVNVMDYCMNDEYLFILISDYRNEQAKYRIEKIKYLQDPINSKASIEVLDEKMLNKHNQQMIQNIKDQYNITVLVDTYDGEKITKDNSVYEDLLFGCDELGVYEILSALQDYLNTLPQGMVEEMIHGYQIFVDNKNIEIYIVKEIIGDSVAYVSQYDNNVRMYLSTSEFNPSTLPHEWMHMMFFKIEDYMYVNDRDFYSEWDQFNPENHQYNVDSLYQEEYFISSYMNTNYDEDIAVLFEHLYMDEDYYWMNDKLKAKANYLTDLIDEVYESVDEDEIWSKYK